MRNFHFEPLNCRDGKVRIPLKVEDVMNYNVYDDMWLDNDDKANDILHLLDQNRIKG